MKPNDDCYCGSGRKYKKCHLRIDTASGADKYRAATKVYANNWRMTSDSHYKKGYYKWMSEQLKPEKPNRILDVGCGSGQGLLSLFELHGAEIRVIAIDENLDCLTESEALLKRSGISSSILKRAAIELHQASYSLSYADISEIADAQVNLIESDVCNDDKLVEFLRTQEKFDAITVWLTGTHMFRQYNSATIERGISTDLQHRLYVQNTVYEMADKLLRSGGVLHIVDRTEFPATTAIEEDFLNAHREQAAPTSLVVESLNAIEYKEPDTRHTPMVVQRGTSGRIPDLRRLALSSVLSRKP